MKTLINLIIAGMIVGVVPHAIADSPGNVKSVFGIFTVVTANGEVECSSDGRIWDLKKGDTVTARGTRVTTKKDANVMLAFSNQTAVYLDQKTDIRIKRFDQEPFTPNNNLGVEPSTSEWLINIYEGQVVADTPQLLSGTHLIFETPFAQILLLNTQSGSDKAFIDVNEKQTHLVVLAGKASIKPRQSNGEYVSISTPVEKDHQAIVKKVIGSDKSGSVATSNGGSDAASALAQTARGASGEFTVSNTSGTVEWVLDGKAIALKKGDHRLAEGISVRTGEKSGATLLLSSGLSVALNPKTELKIDKFNQSAFSASYDPGIEPSNSQTHITLRQGQIGIASPILKVGSSLVIETPHSAISFLNNQPVTGQAFIDVDPKQTHVQLIQGQASVQPRDADGHWATDFPILKTGQQAYIKYTLPADTEKKPDKSGTAWFNPIVQARAATTIAVAPVPIVAPGIGVVSRAGSAVVLRAVGTSESQLPDRAPVPLGRGTALTPGTVVKTGPGSEVFLKTFEGAIAVIHPNSVVRLDDLGIAAAGSAVIRQTARLNLRDGSIDSYIDPRGRNVDDYAVVTPDGVATAHGTGFNATVSTDRSLVTTTADTVFYHASTGTDYPIPAGSALIGTRGGALPLPLSLRQAIAVHREYVAAAETAVSGISTVVHDDVGNLATNSAISLIAQAVGAACAGSPSEAINFVREAVGSARAAGSAVQSNVKGAVAAIVIAAVKAVPDQAAAIAAAASDVDPDLATVIASAAASADPSSGSAIASSVAQSVVKSNPKSSPATILTDVTLAVAEGTTAAAEANGTLAKTSTTLSTSIVVTETTGNDGPTIASTFTQSGSSESSLTSNFSSNFSNDTNTGPGNTNELPSTSMIITQLNGGEFDKISNTLDLAQTAQSTVTFSTTTTTTGNTVTTTVTVTPTVPLTPPNVAVSPAAF